MGSLRSALARGAQPLSTIPPSQTGYPFSLTIPAKAGNQFKNSVEFERGRGELSIPRIINKESYCIFNITLALLQSSSSL